MPEPKLVILCGLPRSGKSTYARKLQGYGYTIICPDEVRLALHGQPFVPSAEGFVWAAAELMARSLLRTDHAVVIDATNTMAKRRAVWVKIAREFGLEPEAVVLDTPLEECHRRNKADVPDRPSLPSNVIDRMASQWEPPTEDEGFQTIHAKET